MTIPEGFRVRAAKNVVGIYYLNYLQSHNLLSFGSIYLSIYHLRSLFSLSEIGKNHVLITVIYNGLCVSAESYMLLYVTMSLTTLPITGCRYDNTS